MLLSRLVVSIFASGLIGLGTSSVFGQDYPNKIVRIVTTPAGGGNDFVARLLAQGISGPLGQPVIVDNRAGAIIAAEFVSRAPPDGYNVLVVGSLLWIFPLLQTAPYDVVRDFSPISLLLREVNVVVVHPSLPVRSIKELIVLAKARPGELNYSSAAVGGPGHLGAELFKSMAGIDIARISYKGAAQAIAGLLGGEVQLTIADADLVAPHVKSGKLRALAVTSANPSALTPGLPTVAASGLPGYEAVGMTNILAPAKTPAAIINRLNEEIVRLLNMPSVKERFLNAGKEIVGSSPEQFAAAIKSDTARMGKVIRDAGIKAE